jgi:hypothetical protein
MTPRIYFDDPAASAPTDVALEAAALASWAGHLADVAPNPSLELELLGLLAPDQEAGEDEADVDDAELFVELKTVKFLRSLGVGLPDALAEIER